MRRGRRIADFQATIDGVATREEVLKLLTAAARNGSVVAAQTLLEELSRERPEGDTIVDELAGRRNG